MLNKELKLNLTSSDISSAHKLGPKPFGPGQDSRKMIVKLCRRDVKRNIMAAARKEKVRGLYVNDCLTPLKRSLHFSARKMMKRHKNVIRGCTTIEGRVILFTAGIDNGKDVRHRIDTWDNLKEFCRKFLKEPLDNFMEQWQH